MRLKALLMALCVSVFAAGVLAAPPTGAVTALRVEPSEIMLVGPRAEARLVVTAHRADGSSSDVTMQAALAVGASKVVRIGPDRVLRPVGDGQARVTAAYEGRTASVTVRVRDARRASPVDFAGEVVPVLTRAGCNQGACHGAQHGKGGFKLSLLGYEPGEDYEAILKQADGKRVNLKEVEKSLILQKPSLQVAHGGGLRLPRDSAGFRLLAGWLRAGAPAPTGKEPAVTRLEVYPKARILSPGEAQSLVVYASFEDGPPRDVTPWARLTPLNDGIAAVTPEGAVKAASPGEAGVMVRYSGQAAVFRATVPYARPASYPKLPEYSFVDTHMVRKWRALGLLPSPLCDDATFLRRVTLDLIGTLPTPEEARAFLADRDPKKRAKLVDRLLERSEYADYWSLKWGDLLRSSRTPLGVKGMWSLTNWIRAQLRANRPADRFARDLLTAQGSTFTNGPANYYRVAGAPTDLAETTSQVFLGTRLQCARCHHHPFERWSQADYYRFAGFFARVGVKGSQEFGIFGNEQVVRVNPGGEVQHPKTQAVMKPAPLGGFPAAMCGRDPKTGAPVEPDPDAGGDRRALLADWVTKDNPLFARNLVNRYWGYLMGRGLYEPVDDQRVTNPPTNPELLDALAKDFAGHGYDLKRLLRTICSSRAYQLSAEPTPQNRADTAFHTHYLLKRLPAEVMLDAVCAATGVPEKYPELPLGTRAIQLPDPQVGSYFLDTFGRAPRVIACECERGAEPTMTQALHLMMGDLVNRKLQDGNNVVGKLIAVKKTDSQIVETLYLAALGRPPRPDEQTQAGKAVRDLVDRPVRLPPLPLWGWSEAVVPRAPALRERDRRAALEDILWALLNSKEFVFNH